MVVLSLRLHDALERVSLGELANERAGTEQLQCHLRDFTAPRHDARIGTGNSGSARVISASVCSPFADNNSRRRLVENQLNVSDVQVLIKGSPPSRQIRLRRIGRLGSAGGNQPERGDEEELVGRYSHEGNNNWRGFWPESGARLSR